MKVIIIFLVLISTSIYSQDSTRIDIDKDIRPLPTTYQMRQQSQNNKAATPKTRKGTKLTTVQRVSSESPTF